MEILDIKENDDGSAQLNIELTKEEMTFFIEYAFIDIIKKQIQREKINAEK